MKRFVFGAAAAVGFALFGGAHVAGAQPVEYVRVCTAFGAQYYYSPGTDTCINADNGQTRRETEDGVEAGETALAGRVSDIESRIANAFNDVAIAAALSDPDLVAGERFGVRVNWGNAGHENAVGLSGAMVLSDGLFSGQGRLTGSGGVAFSGGRVGGRAGLQLTW